MERRSGFWRGGGSASSSGLDLQSCAIFHLRQPSLRRSTLHPHARLRPLHRHQPGPRIPINGRLHHLHEDYRAAPSQHLPAAPRGSIRPGVITEPPMLARKHTRATHQTEHLHTPQARRFAIPSCWKFVLDAGHPTVVRAHVGRGM